MAHHEDIRSELASDPRYAAMTDAEVAEDLNVKRYDVTVNIPRDDLYVQARIDLGEVVGPVAHSTRVVVKSRAEVLGLGRVREGTIQMVRAK